MLTVVFTPDVLTLIFNEMGRQLPVFIVVMLIYAYKVLLRCGKVYDFLFFASVAISVLLSVAFELNQSVIFSILVAAFIYSSIRIGNVTSPKYLTHLRGVLILLLLLALFGSIQYVFYSERFLFYSEPAHAARVLGVGILFLAFVSKNYKLNAASSFVLISCGFITPSVSFLIYGVILLIFGVMMSKIRIFLFSIIPFFLIAYFLLFSNNYFLDRVSYVLCAVEECDIDNSGNLTSLVFLQGADNARISLNENIPTGFGNAYQRNLSTYGEYIRKKTGHNLNLEDAGFVAAKLIIETTWFGVFVLFLYLSNLVKQIVVFIMRNNNHTILSVYLALFPELFLRGAGYFSFGIFLFFCVLGYEYSRRFSY